MAFEFKLPDIGEGVVEGEIVEWLVKEGDNVAEDQPLVAVMTDKATVEIPSPKAGRVTKLGAKPGEIVKVGGVLVAIDTGGATGATATPAPSGKAEPAAKAEAPRPVAAAATAPAQTASATAGVAPVAATPPAPRAVPAAPAREPALTEFDVDSDRVFASPATRKLAREMGVDLADVQGSGPRGRVTREDVEAAASNGGRPRAASKPSPAAESSGPTRGEATAPAPKEFLAIPRREGAAASQVEDRVPLRGLRKKIAEKMHESVSTAAHFAYVDEFDCSELVSLRTRLKPMAERYGVNLTYIPFIMKALVPCLREFPLLNASLDDATSELIVKHYHNIGIAVDTERGLTVPVVKDVDRKSILEIASEMAEMSERARNGRSKLEDLQGGTFTITSTGNIGGLFATPIINHPEVAILGVPKIRRRPWVVKDQIVVRDVLCLAVSLDHRVVDGAVGARFMNRLIEYLSEPSRIFLELG